MSSSRYIKQSSLPYLYFASPDVFEKYWPNTVELTKKLMLPTVKGDVLRKATYPNLFSCEHNLMFPMIDTYGEIHKVVTTRNSSTQVPKEFRLPSYKYNIEMYWPGNINNSILYVVSTLQMAVSVKYAITDNEGIVPDVLFLNSFKHELKNKPLFDKYKYIIMIGSPCTNKMLDIYGIKPTISLNTTKAQHIDPIYVVLKLLYEIINEKSLSKSADLRISTEELVSQYPAILTNVYFGGSNRDPRETLPCLRHQKKKRKRRKSTVQSTNKRHKVCKSTGKRRSAKGTVQ